MKLIALLQQHWPGVLDGDDLEAVAPAEGAQLLEYQAAFEQPQYPIISAASAPDIVRREIDDSVLEQRLARLRKERDRREFALRPGSPGGRDGSGYELTHFIATLAEPGNPRSPMVWAQLETSHPIAKMFRKGSLGKDEAQSFGRYRAAEVWAKFYDRASGRSGYSATMGEHVDGSGDPEAGMMSLMEAVQERLAVMDAKGMTRIRFGDLDSVVGEGNRITDRALATGRATKTVRESILSGLDIVAGFARWDREIQRIQVVKAHDERKRA